MHDSIKILKYLNCVYTYLIWRHIYSEIYITVSHSSIKNQAIISIIEVLYYGHCYILKIKE